MGKYRQWPVADITVPEDRQRTAVSGIGELARSIEENGLINPLSITAGGELLAGERRLTAVKQLGWAKVPCIVRDDPDLLTKERLEFAENAQRRDLPWLDKCRAIERYHKLAGGAVKETAKALNISKRTAYENLRVAQYLDVPGVAAMPVFKGALGYADRQEARAKEIILEPESEPELEPTPKAAAPKAADARAEILCDDFVSWQDNYDGPPFNFIHCDFPYGIGVGDKGSAGQANSTHESSYTDTEATFLKLLEVFCDARHLVANSAHLLFWFDMTYYQTVSEMLRMAGWTIYPHPVLWIKEGNRGVAPDTQRQYRRLYETAFFGAKGRRPLVKTGGNYATALSTTQRHPNAKPLAALHTLFTPLIDSTTRMLDPSCGGGSSVEMSRQLGAEYSLGIEIDSAWARTATEHLTRNDADVAAL